MSPNKPIPRQRKHKTGIFHLHDVGGPNKVEWQQAPRSVPDTDDAVLQRVAFECFLCGNPLNRIRDHTHQDTNEDVFPRWLQRRYDLADLYFPLSDGRKIKYSEALIPACRKCNNVYMSGIEARIAQAVAKGFESFNNLPKSVVFLWCAKIYYGITHFEVQPRDGTTKFPERPSLPPYFLHDIRWLLHLLQGFRKRVLVNGHRSLPFSLLRFPLKTGKDESFYFQCRQPAFFPAIALQMGRVGIISVFDDFGRMESAYEHNFAEILNGRELNPVQFWELAGYLLFVASLYPLHTHFIRIEDELDMQLIYAPFPEPRLAAFSEREAAEWSREFAAPWTRLVTGDREGQPFWTSENGKPLTSLTNEDGSFCDMPIPEEFP